MATSISLSLTFTFSFPRSGKSARHHLSPFSLSPFALQDKRGCCFPFLLFWCGCLHRAHAPARTFFALIGDAMTTQSDGRMHPQCCCFGCRLIVVPLVCMFMLLIFFTLRGTTHTRTRSCVPLPQAIQTEPE